MILKGRVVCSRFFLQLIGFLSVSYQNTKIRQAKKGKPFEAFGRTWRQNSYRTKLQYVCILMKSIFFVDLTNAAKGPNRQRIKDRKGRRPERAIQLKRSPQ